ncbi:M1 family metallopeptidase [Corallococcus sp. bb12-1]|uniref:M1 family metallopeptidase n=1 Tax=Corallococcus sp. bb12-1 TaxID=2996784 RepID=UPI00226EBA96|nr:M1 family metallopeptidase [Corallococcus sp. bb12-1]MCY1042876.1 M1 family metallopeptidase [Corallococcus sp. bb12-1]
MNRLLLLLAVAVTVRCAHAPEAAPPPAAAPVAVAWPEPQPPTLRLPDTVRPLRYALDLKLLPTEATYPGSVAIDVEVLKPVRQVWLHGQDLEVSRARVTVGGRTFDAKPVSESEGRLGLLLPEELPRGTATLTLDFTGKVDRERSQGVYGQAEGGESYLYTFFEPIDARRAFPCFDEPTFKVPWTLRLTVKAGHVALANHPVVSREPVADGLERVTFAQSRPMPSYLVAFIVGPFDVVEAGTVGRANVPLRFIVPKGRGGETRYAASVTPRIVKGLEDFFDQTYPYEKLDVAVVPRYWGTMEHPGLVALGQPLTLIPPGEETLNRRRSYAVIANHELGHYWFSAVVTNAWWNDIWLNESFTAWLDRQTVDRLEPSWSYQQERAMSATESALASDALEAALPVRKPVVSNDDIVGSFDNATTYDKGSSVIAMYEAWLGAERFRDVMRGYVRKHAWGVTTTEDFLAEVSLAAGPEVASSFGGFIEKGGAPRVSAQVTCPAGGAPTVKLSQERYLPVGSRASTQQEWLVPVCLKAGTGTQSARVCSMLKGPTMEVALPTEQCPAWVLLNAGGTGYYRGGYTREQLTKLLATPVSAFTTGEQAALWADVDAAVGRGDLPLGEALKAVPATARSPERLVVQSGASLLWQVRMDRLSVEERKRFRAWVASLYGPHARALGWVSRAGDDDAVKQTRSLFLHLAGGLGDDPALVKEAAPLVRAWLADRESVDPEALSSALPRAAAHGDADLFDALLAAAKKEQDRNERVRLLTALSYFRKPELTRRALALVVGSDFDTRDALGILKMSLNMPETQPLAWEFYRARFDVLAQRLRSDEQGGLINQVGNLCEETQLAEAETFLTPRVKRVEGGPRALARAVESIRLCIESAKLQQQSVRDFLRTR